MASAEGFPGPKSVNCLPNGRFPDEPADYRDAVGPEPNGPEFMVLAHPERPTLRYGPQRRETCRYLAVLAASPVLSRLCLVRPS